MENELTKEDYRAFYNSIGITRFSRVCVAVHNTFKAVWDILVSPFVKTFDFTLTLSDLERQVR